MSGTRLQPRPHSDRRPGAVALTLLQLLAIAVTLVIGVTVAHAANALFWGSSPLIGIVAGVLAAAWIGPTTYRLGTDVVARSSTTGDGD